MKHISTPPAHPWQPTHYTHIRPYSQAERTGIGLRRVFRALADFVHGLAPSVATGRGYDSKDDLVGDMETSAISAAKDFACDAIAIDAEMDVDGTVLNPIDLADGIVNGLLGAGALIPTDLIYDGRGLRSSREES